MIVSFPAPPVKVVPKAIAVPNDAPAVFVTLIAVAAANVLAVNVNAASPDTLIVIAPAAIKSFNLEAVVDELTFNVVTSAAATVAVAV